MVTDNFKLKFLFSNYWRPNSDLDISRQPKNFVPDQKSIVPDLKVFVPDKNVIVPVLKFQVADTHF